VRASSSATSIVLHISTGEARATEVASELGGERLDIYDFDGHAIIRTAEDDVLLSFVVTADKVVE